MISSEVGLLTWICLYLMGWMQFFFLLTYLAYPIKRDSIVTTEKNKIKGVSLSTDLNNLPINNNIQ